MNGRAKQPPSAAPHFCLVGVDPASPDDDVFWSGPITGRTAERPLIFDDLPPDMPRPPFSWRYHWRMMRARIITPQAAWRLAVKAEG